ncbi:hypothetical protein E6W39_11920 [Kitasatospora acidiphila]|uniref:Uncharacterized protein n=1 Tax=Kitasatospora acidiphila TaxID=2567942 RepID=A0A540W1E5_9ACTN|nr:hypothetical protein [Kitasatospora acidiphila]TQF02838.1 hypothetical protein E6W39_11920 [Kitasatospora acidiphila]
MSSENRRRKHERKPFSEATQAAGTPNLPQDGAMTTSYSPVLENANRVGRALDIPERAQAIRTETAAELAAIKCTARLPRQRSLIGYTQ